MYYLVVSMLALALAFVHNVDALVSMTDTRRVPRHMGDSSQGVRTILRPNYGTLFEDVGKLMIGDAGSSVYRHTLAIPIGYDLFDSSKYKLSEMPCNTPRLKKVKCELFNSLVLKANAACMNTLRDSYQHQQMGLKMIPKIDRADDYFTLRKRRPLNANSRRRRRKKRRVRKNRKTYAAKDLIGGESVYDKFKPTGAGGKVLSFIHSSQVSKVGNAIATGLFGLPSMDRIHTMAKHIDQINQAATDVVKGIHNHDMELESVEIQWTSKFKLQQKLSRRVSAEINEMSLANQQLAADDTAHANTVEKKIGLMKTTLNLFLVDVQPKLFDHFLACESFANEMDAFHDAMLTLNKGFLPESLVEPEYLQKLIDHIVDDVLNVGMSKVAGAQLIHKNPLFYYMTEGTTTYTHDEKFLYMTIEFPIYNQGGLLTVYRIHTFDVDVTTGVSERAQKQPTVAPKGSDYSPLHVGSTRVADMSDYLAISDDSEYYFTMKHAYYRTCKSTSDRMVGSLHICKAMVPTLQHSNVRTCETAMFRNSPSLIKKHCRFVHTSETHEGHALQIGQSNLFLVHASSRENDVWTLNCPNEDKKDISPKAFALMSMPCFCSLSTMGFFLPSVMSGCSMAPLANDDESVRLTQVEFNMPINAFLVHNFIDTAKYIERADELHGDTLQPAGKLWPPLTKFIKPINISKLSWTMPIDNVVERTKKYGLDMTKAAAASAKHIKVFVSEVDKGLNKSLDFRDIDARMNDKGPIKAFKDILNIIPGLGDLITALTSGGFLSLMGLTIQSFMFLAVYKMCGIDKLFYKAAKAGHKNRKSKREKERRQNKKHSKTVENKRLLKRDDEQQSESSDSDFFEETDDEEEEVVEGEGDSTV